MSQVENSNRAIRLMVMTIDLLSIALLLVLFEWGWLRIFGERMFEGDKYIVIFVLCASYAVGSYFSGMVLYHRGIRVDQVVVESLKNMAAFYISWLAISSLLAPTLNRSLSFSYFFIFAAIAITALRVVSRLLVMLYRKQGYNQCRVIYLGSGGNMQELFGEMALRLTTGYQVLGYFDSHPNVDFDDRCRYLGGNDEALEYISSHNVDRVYCGLSSSYGESVMVPLINYCERNLIRFYAIPNLRNYFHRRLTLEMFSDVPMFSIHAEPLAMLGNRVAKRALDIVVSGVFLVTLFPIIYLVVGAIIKLSSPGEVLFRQRRHGLDGKEFWCYKFRSMRLNDDSDSVQATERDPRKTKFGDFLRRTSIDELPQFYNVLRGDMSIVGPRPHMLKHTEEYSHLIETYMVRHYIRPGITGWAQVTGFRGETKELSDMQGRVKADIWYLEHWSLILDIYIIYKTIVMIITRSDKKAY